MGISKYENAAAVDEALDKGVEAFNKTQGGFAAENVSYDNSKSEIEAENVQDAIDSMKDEFHAEITHVNTSIAGIENQIGDINSVLEAVL